MHRGQPRVVIELENGHVGVGRPAEHPARAARTVLEHHRHLVGVLHDVGARDDYAGVLTALADFGPQSQQELADSLDFDKSHLVARIDHLQSRGLVTRTPDPADRRRNQIALTPAGHELVDSLRPVAQESQQARGE